MESRHVDGTWKALAGYLWGAMSAGGPGPCKSWNSEELDGTQNNWTELLFLQALK